MRTTRQVARPARPATQAATPGADAEKPLVLVIDDDAAVQKAIATWLKGNGFAVLLAGSTEEALPLLQRHAPDIVVADVQLPGLDGIAALRAVREADRDVQTYLMSAYPPPENPPGVRFFAKPHEIPALMDLLIAGNG